MFQHLLSQTLYCPLITHNNHKQEHEQHLIGRSSHHCPLYAHPSASGGETEGNAVLPPAELWKCHSPLALKRVLFFFLFHFYIISEMRGNIIKL